MNSRTQVLGRAPWLRGLQLAWLFEGAGPLLVLGCQLLEGRAKASGVDWTHTFQEVDAMPPVLCFLKSILLSGVLLPLPGDRPSCNFSFVPESASTWEAPLWNQLLGTKDRVNVWLLGADCKGGGRGACGAEAVWTELTGSRCWGGRWRMRVEGHPREETW